MSTGLSRVSLLAVALALQLACGGGGGGGGGTTTPPKPPTGSLGITPGSAAVASGTSLRLTALTSNVTGASAYTWSVQETGMGQLHATGDGRAADYLAPATAGTYHVVVSTVPAGLSATAEVKVASADDSSFFRLQISPYKMNMKVRETARSGVKARGKKEVLPPPSLRVAAFTEWVEVPVIWSIAEGALGGSVVPASGVYTAPAQPGVYHLVATAIENPRVQGSMEIRVFDELPPSVAAVGGGVATRPGVAYLEPLDQTFLRAVASGTASPLVAWSLLEGSTGGSLSAPTGGPDNEIAYTAASSSGSFHAQATAVSDPALQAQTILQVGPRTGLAVVPSLARIAPGEALDLRAVVTDTSLQEVEWSSPDPSGGVLAPSGLTARYTAPATPGIYYVSVRPKADLEKAVLARLEVTGAATPTVKILPWPTRIQPGTQLQLVAQVLGTSNTAVTWSTTAGSISPEGLLSAPATLGPVTVTAKSVADTARQDSVTIAVNNLPVFVTVPPVNANPTATYTYIPAASHPDALGVVLTLASGPSGATFSGGTLQWLPAPAQYELENQFVLKATDSQGGASVQRWTVNFRVSGQWRTLFHSLDGVVATVPADLSALTMAAHVPSGPGFQTYAGTGTASGTFWIPGVPPGYYWLQKDKSYDWVDTSRVDFRFDRVGRPDGFQPPTLPTTATFNIGGMTAWNVPLSGPRSGLIPHQLVWYDPNNPSNSGFDYLDEYLAPPLQAPGATAMTGSLNLQGMQFSPNLSSTALGDRPIIFHYDVIPAPGGDWQPVVREAFQPASLAMVNGVPFTVTGTFSRAYPQVAVDLSVDVAPLPALKTVVAPAAATFHRYTFLVDAELPSGRSDLVWLQGAGTPPLHQLLWSQSVPATGIMATGPITVLNFFPNGYVLSGLFSAAWRMAYLLPGTSTPFRQAGYVNASIAGTSGTIQLTHRPATLLINGATATSDLSGVGTTPVLRVVADAFTAGHSPARTIQVRRLGVNGAATVSETSYFLFHFPVNEDFRLPPGILEAGKTYAFSVLMNSSGEPGLGGAGTISGLIMP